MTMAARYGDHFANECPLCGEFAGFSISKGKWVHFGCGRCQFQWTERIPKGMVPSVAIVHLEMPPEEPELPL